jgi:hypothetical protein
MACARARMSVSVRNSLVFECNLAFRILQILIPGLQLFALVTVKVTVLYLLCYLSLEVLGKPVVFSILKAVE